MRSSRRSLPIRVLVVDDSALIRKILVDGLSRNPKIQVIGTARDPYLARDILVRERPDVVLLDIEMPRMDGLTLLRRYMPVIPTPTIVLSALTREGKQISTDALLAGAVGVMAKPRGIVDHLPAMIEEISEKILAAAEVQLSGLSPVRREKAPIERLESRALEESTDKVIALGASTGGVEALARILPKFPVNSPGIVLVEHMPAGFTAPFAKRLDQTTGLSVKEAEDGDRILPGKVLLAPGGEQNLVVFRSGGEYRVRLIPAIAKQRHTPSVDILFHSVAREVGRNAVAALLTGMGSDGAQGLRAIRDSGGRTFAQDEKTSVVFGMPQAAYRLGAAEKLVPLEEIPRTLISALREASSATPELQGLGI